MRPALLLPLLTSAALLAQAPAYICQRAAAAPAIDGRLDDAVWRAARWTEAFVDIEGARKPPPAHRTRAKLAWDDRCLYIAAELEEPHLRATLRERDSVIFQDPDFEVFLDPAGDGRQYLELEVNALNTVWDLWLTRPYRAGGEALHDWDIKGLRSAVALDGTLNDPRDTDRAWTVELAIPWTAITGVSRQPRLGAAPRDGDIMRLNFARVDWRADAAPGGGYAKRRDAAGRVLPELNRAWAPQHAIDMHRPEHWGSLVFSARPAGAWEAPPPAPDEALRAELFRLHRELAERFKATGAYPAALPPVQDPAVREAFASARYAVANGRRYALDLVSPRTGVRLGMAEDGVLTASRPDRRSLRAADFKASLWMEGHDDSANAALWRARFADYRRAGIDAVMINGREEDIGRLAPLAVEAGLEAAAWIFTLQRHGDAEALRHPDWYAVSRDGKSCFDAPPYVDYYRFLCPTHPGVRAHLRALIARHAALPGLSALQLDYIRVPDVILPKGLWKKYGLVMDKELAPYDFCYCPHCLKAFEAAAGRPVAPDPTADAAWRAFREHAIRDLVAELGETARAARMPLHAAVFPYPELAATLVRQRWDAWALDAALPMDYHGFYDEPAAWVGDATRRAAGAVEDRIPVHPGLYLPDLAPGDLETLVNHAADNGAAGIALFSNRSFEAGFQERLPGILARIRARRAQGGKP